LENERLSGGTLGVSESEYLTDDSLVRVAVAKTKGKHRVVTMQSARVKRVLSPVHNALYDHISSFEWCVRGDVGSEHLAPIVDDRRPGESFISGDYAAATDGIYLPAVRTVIGVLAEDPSLTENERKVLLGSFENLRWRSRSGRQYPIMRGSMMGNLVSFPLLCLLNKACFDIACDISYGCGHHRVGRFNGDDCAFAGSRDFFCLWRLITSTFGFKVNEEKTGFSRVEIELNSRTFLVRDGKLVSKPVISFLRPDRYCPQDLLTEVIRGTEGLNMSTRLWVVNVLMRHEISLREIDVSEIPTSWLKYLLKKRWFRTLLGRGPPVTKECGEKRAVDACVGLPPFPEAYPVIRKIAAAMERTSVNFWRGRKVAPFESRLVRLGRRGQRPYEPTIWKYRVEFSWTFVWPRELYELVESTYPSLLMRGDDVLRAMEIEDSPFICLSQHLKPSSLRRCFNLIQSPPPRCFLRGLPCSTGGVFV
jgi:hypothetical protein